MFEITEETRNAAIAEMAKIISVVDIDNLPEDALNEVLGNAFDAAVICVKRQFGM